MGAKKVKAIVVDLDRIPPFEDSKKVNAAIKTTPSCCRTTPW